jgi:hypothetical protein
MNNHPEFDSHRYTEHDLAKYIIAYDFGLTGWLDVHVNPDTYGADLIATSGRTGAIWTIEVEVKRNWDTGAFKYKTIHIAHRKAKFNNPHHMHVTVNKDWTHYLMIPPSALREGKPVVKSTYLSDKELFIEIPITECQIIERKNT